MKNENHRALFDAVSGIDDDLIEEAAAPKTIRFPRRIRRLAAIAAVIAILMTALLWPSEENYITGPGVLVVRAYEMDEPILSEENSAILEEGITLPLAYNWAPNKSNIAQGLPLHLSLCEDLYENAEISFEITISDGSFTQDANSHIEDTFDGWKKMYLGNNFTIKNNHRVYWLPFAWVVNEENISNHTFMENNYAFADIIIRANKRIIGYAVIEFYEVNGNSGKQGFYYNARMLKTVSFPKIDGHFQNVSKAYVNEQFKLIHKNSQPLGE